MRRKTGERFNIAFVTGTLLLLLLLLKLIVDAPLCRRVNDELLEQSYHLFSSYSFINSYFLRINVKIYRCIFFFWCKTRSCVGNTRVTHVPRISRRGPFNDLVLAGAVSRRQHAVPACFFPGRVSAMWECIWTGGVRCSYRGVLTVGGALAYAVPISSLTGRWWRVWAEGASSQLSYWGCLWCISTLT